MTQRLACPTTFWPPTEESAGNRWVEVARWPSVRPALPFGRRNAPDDALIYDKREGNLPRFLYESSQIDWHLRTGIVSWSQVDSTCTASISAGDMRIEGVFQKRGGRSKSVSTASALALEDAEPPAFG